MAELKLKLILDKTSLKGISGKIGGGGDGNTKQELSGLNWGRIGKALGIAAVVGILAKTSPYLAAQLDILKKGFSLVLRPFGDMLGMLFRPLAIFMLRTGVKFYKWWLDKGRVLLEKLVKRMTEFGGSLKEAYKKGGVLGVAKEVGGKALGGAIAVGKKLLEWAGIAKDYLVKNLPAMAKTLTEWGALLSAWIIAKIPVVIDTLFEWVNTFVEWITAKIPTILDWLLENLKTSIAFFADFGEVVLAKLLENLPKFIQNLIDAFVAIGNWIVANIPNMVAILFTAISAIGSAIVSIGAWLLAHLPEILKGAFIVLLVIGKVLFALLKGIFSLSFKILSGVGAWMWRTLKKIMKTSLEALSGFGAWVLGKLQSLISAGISFVMDKISFWRNTKDKSTQSGTDVIITKKGDIVRTHPQDTIMAFKGAPQMGGGMTFAPTININGSLGSDAELRDFGRKLSEIMYENIRRRVSF
jgi:hypothetical protein